MALPSSDLSANAAFEAWLKNQILQLSVETLKSNAITCTACGEVLGTYIIEYQGNQFRCSPEQAYSFLKFIAEATP